MTTIKEAMECMDELKNSMSKWGIGMGNVEDIPVEHQAMYLNHKDDENIERFEKIMAEMITLYAKKNKDYGNSFDISLDEDGLLVAKIRLGDKYNRFSSLIKKKQQEVAEESKRDTLIDMANYAIMTVMWMDLQKEKSEKSDVMKKFDCDDIDPLTFAHEVFDTFAGKKSDDLYVKGNDIKSGKYLYPYVATLTGADLDGDKAYFDIDAVLERRKEGYELSEEDFTILREAGWL